MLEHFDALPTFCNLVSDIIQKLNFNLNVIVFRLTMKKHVNFGPIRVRVPVPAASGRAV